MLRTLTNISSSLEVGAAALVVDAEVAVAVAVEVEAAVDVAVAVEVVVVVVGPPAPPVHPAANMAQTIAPSTSVFLILILTRSPLDSGGLLPQLLCSKFQRLNGFHRLIQFVCNKRTKGEDGPCNENGIADRMH